MPGVTSNAHVLNFLTSRNVWNVLPELAPLRGKVRRNLAASLEPIVTTPDHLNVQLAS